VIQNINRVAGVLLAASVLLTGGLVYWQVIRGSVVANDSGNPRVAEAAKTEERGSIIDRNGTVLVESKPQPDGTRKRVYNLPSLGATTGYVSTRFGLSGVEQAYNRYLSGAHSGDPLTSVRNALFHESVPGDELILTIDSKLQSVAASALGDRRGAVVVMDPHTGAIVAMVSSPAYDPAQIDQSGDALLSDPGKPLLNRTTQGLYPPGSTYKTVTASAALDTGVVKPDDRFKCVNGVVIQGFVIQCTNAPQGQTEWDFLHAYAFSINATFAQVAAERLGSDRFIAYSRKFGLDHPLPFDINTAMSRTSRSGGGLNQVLLASSGFGQGQLVVSPLQMALVTATVANHGIEPAPYLVQEIRDAAGNIVEEHSQTDRGRVMSEATAAEMVHFMETAVNEGFGSETGLLGMGIAGKTGTAETGTDAPADAWFTGFAPSNAPSLVVVVEVDDGGPGSRAAAPVAQQIFQAFLGQ